MKQFNQILPVALLYAGLLLCGGCSPDHEMDSSSETGNPRVPLIIRATASGFDHLTDADGSSGPTTRVPEENGLETYFQTGTAIGLFAVSGIGTAGGKIMDKIDNTKLTYTSIEGSLGGTWTPPDGVEFYYNADATYIAYYPYKEGISITPTNSLDAIIASIEENYQPAADQSTPEAYAAADLMIASGTAAEATKILTLNLNHRFCLLMVFPRVPRKCVVPEGGGFTYCSGASVQIPDADAANVTLNECIPYKDSDGNFRIIAKPTSSPTAKLKGSYTTTDGRTISYESEYYLTGFAAGNSYLLNVNNTFSDDEEIVRALAPGDFVFHGTAGIEIYPGNGAVDANGRIPNYEQTVGIVVTCDKSRMTDKECSAKGWDHAYVMGVGKAISSTTSWATSPTTDTAIPNTETWDAILNDMNGYDNTEKLLEQQKDNLPNYPQFSFLIDYRNGDGAVPASISASRSPWFLPSIGQWGDVYTNIGGGSFEVFTKVDLARYEYADDGKIFRTVLSHIAKANSSDQNNIMWVSSSEYSSENIWCFRLGHPYVVTAEPKKNKFPLWFFFAF